MRRAPTAVLLVLLAALGRAAPAAAQNAVDAAMTLYSTAAYEEALAALERLPADGVTREDRASRDRVRMLCLLALGRTAEAERAMVSLLQLEPAFRLKDDDAAPRVLRVFNDVRRRTLPDVVRERYREAKRLYDDKQFEQADAAFAAVRDLLADPDLAGSDPSLGDLDQLAQGFADLTRATLETRRATDAATRAERDTATQAAAAAAATPVPPPVDLPSRIFDMRDVTVVPPQAERQTISRWFGPVPPPRAGTTLGAIEVVIDESGAVAAAAISTSVNGFYDAVLLESAKQWHYRPALKDGRAVKYRRVIAIVAGR